MLGFYMDDSADSERKKVFSVAGFVGKADVWFDIEQEWNARLERDGIDYFKTSDCINLKGEFERKLVDCHGMTTARVIADAILRDLRKIVARSPMYGYSLGVLMEDYRTVLAEPDGAIVLNPDPYIFAHHVLIGKVCDDVHALPRDEVVAFLYDEHSKATLLKESWAGFKEQNPTWAQHAGTLAPLDDKTHAPIQMADLLAHATTKVHLELPTDPTAAQRRFKDWLGSNLMRTPYLDAKFLRLLVAHNIARFRLLGAHNGLVPKLPPSR